MIKALFARVLVRNTIWMVGGQGLRLAIQALYFIEIARSLGVRNYGAFVGVVALVGIAVPFGSLGSGHLLIRSVSRDPRAFPESWGRSLLVTSCCGSILLIGVLLASHFALGAQIPLRLVALVGASDLLGLNIITLAAQAFQAFERLNWTAAVWVMMSVGRLTGALLAVHLYTHASALQWAYWYFLSNAVVALTAALLVSWKLGAPQWPHGVQELREGSYFSVSLSAQTIYNDIDKTMLARLSTLDATGIYGAAYRLIDVSNVPISALLYSAYPKLFRVGLGGIGSTFIYTRRLLLRALAYGCLVCFALQLSAGLVAHILGPGYANTANALRWLSVLPMIKAVHYFLSDTLTGAGHQRLRSAIQVGVAIFNVLINLWLIPIYSWRGAAWSSIASDGLLACAVGTAVFVLVRRTQESPDGPIKAAVGVGI